MSRITIITGLGVVLVSFFFGLGVGSRLVSKPVSPPTKEERFVLNAVYTLGGTFDQIEGKNLVLTSGQERLAVECGPETRITLLAKVNPPSPGLSTASAQSAVQPEITREIPPSALEKGDRLTIKAELVKDKFVARTITASR